MAIVKLHPACKDYIWGGTKLKELYNKQTDMDPLAETWELSTHKDGQSEVVTGDNAGKTLSQYIEDKGWKVLGTECRDMKRFPVLIKFIDAKQPLSIQVHPDDEYAWRVEGEPGKTEMWYILDAEPDAFLYFGVKRHTDREEFRKAIEDGTVLDLLRAVPCTKEMCSSSNPVRSTPSVQAFRSAKSSRTPTPPTVSTILAGWERTESPESCTLTRRWMCRFSIPSNRISSPSAKKWTTGRLPRKCWPPVSISRRLSRKCTAR